MLSKRFNLAVVATAAATLLPWAPSPASAAGPADPPFVTSAEVLSAEGEGCAQPAVQVGDGTLSVIARTDSDASLIASAWDAAGQPGVSAECTVLVRVRFDKPAEFKASEYPMSGSVGTTAGTTAARWFQSSVDGGATWYGQSTTESPGASGPFYQSSYPRLAPWTACGREADVHFRVGLSLNAEELQAQDYILLDSPHGAMALTATESCS